MSPPSHRIKNLSTGQPGHDGSPFRRRQAVALIVLALLVAGVAATAGSGEDTGKRGAADRTTTATRGVFPRTPTGDPLNQAAAGQLCFGAASRDPERPCGNPDLRLKVVPTPEEAVVEPNARCTPVGRTATLLPCGFGVPKAQATEFFALIGDSHASQWRATLEGVAQAKGWYGTSLTKTSCPFSRAVTELPAPAGAECVRWNRAALAWLFEHPEVTTVFVGQHSGGDTFSAPGRTEEQTQVAGYAQVWRALPPTVKQVFVIRDTPRNTGRSIACVERAMAARRRPGTVCAVPRRVALRPDPAAIAARLLNTPAVRLVNLTRYMCTERMCPPVIGGALVRKDIDHFTQTFAASLAPYMLRRVNAVLGE